METKLVIPEGARLLRPDVVALRLQISVKRLYQMKTQPLPGCPLEVVRLGNGQLRYTEEAVARFKKARLEKYGR